MDLLLNTYGASLTRDDDCLLVKSKDIKQKFSVNDINNIQLSNGTYISSDAIILAIKNEIPVYIIDASGKTYGRLWSPKYGSISTIRKGQLAFCNSEMATEWIRNLLKQKIESQEALLLLLSNYKSKDVIRRTEKAIARMQTYLKKIANLGDSELGSISGTLRAWEGAVAKIYFAEISMYLPKELKFETRSQHPSMDLFNAFLNFGYGILYTKVESALIKAGVDPYIGILHRDNYNTPSLVFDVIEPFRAWVDYVVINLLCQLTITDDMYSIESDGSYWLKGIAKQAIIQSVNDFLEEPVQCGKEMRMRQSKIEDAAYHLARKFASTNIKKL